MHMIEGQDIVITKWRGGESGGQPMSKRDCCPPHLTAIVLAAPHTPRAPRDESATAPHASVFLHLQGFTSPEQPASTSFHPISSVCVCLLSLRASTDANGEVQSNLPTNRDTMARLNTHLSATPQLPAANRSSTVDSLYRDPSQTSVLVHLRRVCNTILVGSATLATM